MLGKYITRNTLFYGDNLKILREYFPDESVDLIYLDPPFNSNRTYNILFKEESGFESEAQIKAFDDTWHWNQIAVACYREIVKDAPFKVSKMIQSLKEFIGENQMMAYLVMMTIRLIEMHRVLKPTGSIYLHCDPTASHYLRLVLESIFGKDKFKNEIIWHYSRWTAEARKFQKMHDVIFWFSKSDNYVYILKYQNYKTQKWIEETVRGFVDGKLVRLKDKDGKYIKREKENIGVPMHDVWDDINFIAPTAKERLGYPTQKPVSLLERILEASSNEGDIVLDPFCGCGTTIAAAQKLNRRWVGIDITHLAVALQKFRLQEIFELNFGKDYDVMGEPEDLASAKSLALQDRYQFQYWAVSLVRGKPVNGELAGKKGKKGADRGIDGVVTFEDLDEKGKLIYKRIVIQVKSGAVKAGDIRDFRGTIERENVPIGVFITLEEPTKPMIQEALSAGNYASKAWGKEYSRIQILTIEALLEGAEIKMPENLPQFKKAGKSRQNNNNQKQIFDK